MNSLIYIFLFTLVALLQTSVNSTTTTTLYVNLNSTSTSVDCGIDITVANACPDLQSALTSFTKSGVIGPLIILLAGGVYTGPGNANIQVYNQTITIDSADPQGPTPVAFNLTTAGAPYFIQIAPPANTLASQYDSTFVTLTHTYVTDLKLGVDQPGGVIFANVTSGIVGISLVNDNFYNISSIDIINVITPPNPPNVTITDCEFRDLQAGHAIISLVGASLALSNSVFTTSSALYFVALGEQSIGYFDSNNYAYNSFVNNNGAIIYVTESFGSYLEGERFEYNYIGNGALFQVYNAWVQTDSLFFINNNSTAIAVSGQYASLNMTYTKIFFNFGSVYGQVYVSDGANATLIDCVLDSGGASFGGALALNATAYVTLERITLTNNTASNVGGAIYANSVKSLVIQDSELANNQAQSVGGGGAIYATNSPSVAISNTVIDSNNAADGAGITCQQSSVFTLDTVSFTNNTDSAADATQISCLGNGCLVSGNSGSCNTNGSPTTGATGSTGGSTTGSTGGSTTGGAGSTTGSAGSTGGSTSGGSSKGGEKKLTTGQKIGIGAGAAAGVAAIAGIIIVVVIKKRSAAYQPIV
ncbi:hypothetical protein DFA_10703 [Cavenderia fasciculata]|uniref:Right handed beta helix domain-containing protein n=1 Tax=Cavenderia fasciculata TaxID=261658 RepID=F4QB58_CACFS|nr:uncharacterized protein DFA_10703 [Cavenderia fasciculata]EGG14830.1 hypothetical protein DFA_10703 [Cavenderia fasciculata]|eukprot:XP_004351346.1 hypothetical protein DFA_10703 [Cavenderia fasciculata]